MSSNIKQWSRRALYETEVLTHLTFTIHHTQSRDENRYSRKREIQDRASEEVSEQLETLEDATG